MPLLISLEAKIDNSGHGEMVSVGFIHANISDLAWMSKAFYMLSERNCNTARHLNDQKTKSRLNPVCIEIITLILNFIKVSNGHRVGVYLKALHEQLFALLYVLDGPNPVEECTLIDFRERFHTSQIWHSNFPLITKVYLHSAF